MAEIKYEIVTPSYLPQMRHEDFLSSIKILLSAFGGEARRRSLTLCLHSAKGQGRGGGVESCHAAQKVHARQIQKSSAFKEGADPR